MGSGDDTFAVEAEPTHSLSGDLASYVTSESLAPLLGLKPVAITPYRAVAESAETGPVDLFGNEGGRLDLVGTSYSANPDWSFAEALKLALHRDVVNNAEEGQGPFAPMRAYLDRLDPLAPPETVIWEIPMRYLADPDLPGDGATG